jgi:hypothetical protein
MIKCPNCGESYYTEHYSTTTAMGWSAVYKDGKMISENPNITVSYCTCCSCHHDFHYTEQYGKIIECIDDGKKPEVPTIEFSSINGYGPLDIDPKILCAKSSIDENGVTIPTMEDIEDIKKRLDRLETRVFDYRKE